jgi:peptidoglycan hydrolase-like protein with peptidoglycan-binding domain
MAKTIFLPDAEICPMPPMPNSNLAPGSTGDMVSALQYALIANGYSVGPAGANGTFDDDTTNALRTFQDDHALPVQPLCDTATWTALFSAS